MFEPMRIRRKMQSPSSHEPKGKIEGSQLCKLFGRQTLTQLGGSSPRLCNLKYLFNRVARSRNSPSSEGGHGRYLARQPQKDKRGRGNP